MEKNNTDKYVVDETIQSIWYYHIREKENNHTGAFKSLCGTKLLGKELPLSTWNTLSGHIPQHFCKECNKILNQLKENK